MATDAELIALGFSMPGGTSLISSGDDDLKKNAHAAFGLVMSHTAKRGVMPDAADLSAWFGSAYVGDWYCASAASAATMLDLPPGVAGAFNLMVKSGPPGFSHTTQVVSVVGSSPALWWRNTSSSGVFNAWKRLDSAPGATPVVFKGLIPDGSNLDLWYGDEYRGEYYIASTPSAQTMLGLPVDIGAGNFRIYAGGPNYSHTTQVYMIAGSNGVNLTRTTTGSGVWGDWEPLGGSAGGFALDSGHYGQPNAYLLEDFKAAHPPVSTGNKGALMIRFDHGLTYLKSTILPMLDSRGWKSIIAMNSRNWTKDENSGMTPAELSALITAGKVEVANHTADGNMTGAHKDLDTKEAIFDGIVNGRTELEAQLGHKIEHFIVPGTVNGMGGFLQGASLDVYSRTYAGSLIMANHAVFSGGFADTRFRKLDGRVKQGQQHWNIETQTVAAVKAQIDIAVSTKTGLQLMMHPRNINQPGYLSLAGLTEIFQYVDTLEASNQLVVLGTSESLRATL